MIPGFTFTTPIRLEHYSPAPAANSSRSSTPMAPRASSAGTTSGPHGTHALSPLLGDRLPPPPPLTKVEVSVRPVPGGVSL